MTRGGVEALKQQLWAEAMRHGLSQAQLVLVIADGAVWIWNLVRDRFPEAVQRLDPWHALEHLWAVPTHSIPKTRRLRQHGSNPSGRNCWRARRWKSLPSWTRF